MDRNLVSFLRFIAFALLGDLNIESIRVCLGSFFTSLNVAFLEELQFFLLIWNNRGVSGLPISRANFSMCVGKLKCFNQTNHLVDWSAYRSVVYLYGSEFACAINDIKTSEGGSVEFIIFVINQDAEVSGEILADVSDEREIHVTKTTFLSVSLDPSKMSEMWVGADS